MSPKLAHSDIKNDERREWLRIDDRLLLEYRLHDEPAEVMNRYLPPATGDTIATAVELRKFSVVALGVEDRLDA
jgi:hypothetical protein